jgi:hypothetical protein
VIHPSVQAPPIGDGLQFMLARVVVHETGPGNKVVHRLEDVRDVHVSSPDNHLASTGHGLRVGARLLRFRHTRPGLVPTEDGSRTPRDAGWVWPTMFTKQCLAPVLKQRVRTHG